MKFRKLRCSELLFRDGKPSNSYTTFVDELPFGRLIKSVWSNIKIDLEILFLVMDFGWNWLKNMLTYNYIIIIIIIIVVIITAI